MSALVEELAPETTDEDDEPIHITCCADDDVALCGTDLTGDVWVEDVTEPTTCRPCATTEARLDAIAAECPDQCPVSALRSLKGPKKP